MKEDYLKNMLKVPKLCEELRELVWTKFYKKDGSLKRFGRDGCFCWYPIYRQIFRPIKSSVQICDLFGVSNLERRKPTLTQQIGFLEDYTHTGRKNWFDNSLEILEKAFNENTGELKRKISLLYSEEKDRLDEAIHCFLEGCYYSTIAMSVSAIESRLFSLMLGANPKAELGKLTLGQLITEYLENKEKYDNVIPKKHEPLLRHCNVYRVFSVHPKKEEIGKPVASSIFNLTFLFLLDEKLAKQNKSTSREK